MTTIATDGRSMAADGQRSQNGTIVDTTAVKVQRLNDGRLIGHCGDVAEGMKVVEWLRSGKDEDKPVLTDGTVALVLNLDGTAHVIDRHCQPIPIPTPAAVGSGMDFALGAMEMGASPQEAVEIASRRDTGTGGTITVLSLEQEAADAA